MVHAGVLVLLLGVLILWHLRRAIWVIILDQRQHSGTYTHSFFYVTYTPIHLPPPPLPLLFLPFWTSSADKWCTCCLSPMLNVPCMSFESSPLRASLRWQGSGSTGAVARQDPPPGGGGGSTDPKMVLRNNCFCGRRR